MQRFGLLGAGTFGKLILSKLNRLGSVVWVAGSDTDYQTLELPDWVFIATPNQFHFEQVEYFIRAGSNVFVEKPATLSPHALSQLIELSRNNGGKFYIDDVFRFRGDVVEAIQSPGSSLRFIWKKAASSRDGALLDRLAYHHLYLIYDSLGEPGNIQLKSPGVFDPDRLCFSGEVDGCLYEFEYDCSSQPGSAEEHVVFGRSLEQSSTDPLAEMLTAVINERVSFEDNHRRAMWATSAVAKLKQELYPTVGIVGGGIFGSTTAIEIATQGYNVTLHERHDELLQEASSINQYRIHHGYHYPRSPETAGECLSSATEFMKAFRQAVTTRTDGIVHQYAIASESSMVTADCYIDFLERMELPYKVSELLPGTDLTIEVPEVLFSATMLRSIMEKRLVGAGVNVRLGNEASANDLNEYDYQIYATYANLNDWVEEPRDYQFEVCEKPVLKLPEEFARRSVVIMDGPFMCIDPLPATEFHVMGNVVHAIHHSNIGKRPEIPVHFERLLNKGVISNPPVTHIDSFLNAAEKFFPGISRAQHIGSMFTIRTVLPGREHDDARPTLVESLGQGKYLLFSGKVCTCVRAAKELAECIKVGTHASA